MHMFSKSPVIAILEKLSIMREATCPSGGRLLSLALMSSLLQIIRLLLGRCSRHACLTRLLMARAN